MAYVVSARKYRPQLFEDVVGQEHVTSTIKNALLNDKLAHAFLFCGPRGVGKTTCARLLAKVINMPDPKQSIVDGSYAESDIDISLNIVELDAASNNSVDNMRTLIEQVRFQPQQGKYKVFIIDEVHMLSISAFNAFLKTLEEPPPYAIFILATTERHKILPTILSRCQLYDFRRIQIADIISQLEHVAEKEGIETEHDALYVIAEKADGAMRDALSIFDRVASASESKITLQQVVDNLNILDFDYFFDAVNSIIQEDASGLILLFDKVLKNGFEGDTFMNGLAQHLRYLMYSKQEETQEMLQMSQDLKDRYMQQSKTISYATIVTGLSLANQADLDFLKAKDKRLHIEVALLKICYASRKMLPQIGAAPTHSAQKKTADPSITSGHSAQSAEEAPSVTAAHIIPSSSPVIRKNESAPQEKVEEKSETSEPVKDTAPSEIAPAPKEEIVIQKEAAPISISTETITPATEGVIHNTPKMSSIADILKQAQEEITTNDANKIDVSLEEVESVWTTYVSTIQSPTTAGILKTVIRDVKEGKILVTVPSNIAKEEVQQEAGLYALLREHFNESDLVITLNVDREQFPDLVDNSSQKLVTVREKYEHLKAINPLVENLIKQLELKPDE